MRKLLRTAMIFVSALSTSMLNIQHISVGLPVPLLSTLQAMKTPVEIKPFLWDEWNTGDVYNHELEYYAPQAVRFNGEGLTITASRRKVGNKNFVSGRVAATNFMFEYGEVLATMKLPIGTGTFPALWLRPASGGILPEIDIMENIGRDPGVIVPAYHETSGEDLYTRYTLNSPTQFHTYVLIWQPRLLEWIIDGNVVLKTTNNVPHQPMYVTINLAIGGTWPHNPDSQTQFPQSFVIQRIVVAPNYGPSLVGDRELNTTIRHGGIVKEEY